MRTRALALALGLVAPSAAEPLFVPRERSAVRPLAPAPAPPRPIANPLMAMDLSRSLDSVRAAGPVKIGKGTYQVGVAADPEFKYFFLVFTSEGMSRLEPIRRPRDFIGKGAAFAIDGKIFLFKVNLKLSDPVRGSELKIIPVDGKPGEEVVWTTGELLELMQRKTSYMRIGEHDYSVAYLSDIDPQTGLPTGTRSFLFFHESRFRPRSYRLPESAIPGDGRLLVTLGEDRVLLERRGNLLTAYPAR